MEASITDDMPTEHQGNAKKNTISEGDNEDRGQVDNKIDVIDIGASHGPQKVLQPLRTDAVKALQSRQRRLERLSAVSIPELHYVGQIVSGKGIALDSSEGACCR